MLLAVDVGNTQTVLGLYAGKNLCKNWRIATSKTSTADEIHIVLRDLLSLDGYTLQDINSLALASVVPSSTEVWSTIASKLDIPLVMAGQAASAGLPIHYSNPREIGADRIADAVAAIELYGAPVIVVDLGTATNIEVIDKEGAFIGGIIAPGLETSADALFQAAARLSRIDVVEPEKAIGTSTRMAVQSGLVYGEVARIDGLVQRVFDELGYETPVVATGGIARRIASLSTMVTDIDENLTLTGLRIIYEQSQKDVRE